MVTNKEFWEKLLQYNKILIGIHVNPDGDCIGAALAMKYILKHHYNKKVTVFSNDPIPKNVNFLRYTDDIITENIKGKFDVLLLLDLNNTDRTKIPLEVIPENIFVIDHHELGNVRYNEEIIHTEASSTCEILYDIFKDLNEPISKNVAECLLTGIICDTGSFAHSNTKGKVLKISGELTDLGANPHFITKKYFNENPISSLYLLGYVLNNLKTFHNNEIIIGYVDNEYLIKNHINIDSDTVNQSLSKIEGHKITAFLRETEPNKVRVSLRSPNAVDCNNIANKFEGGGHINAAGCTIRYNIDDTINILVNEIEKHL